MAGNAVIGALRVVIGADSAALDKGLKDASETLREFGTKLQTAGMVAGAAITSAFVGIGLAIKGSLESADKLNKLSQTIGVPVEELSKLKHAADLSDVSLESLGTSLGRLSKNMVAFAADATSEAGAGLRALGINVRNADGTLKSSSTVLGEIAEKFAGYKDGAEKTALAIAIFGRAGAAMIPLLNGGKEAIEEAGKEAEELGIVLDNKTAVAAENFNDNLTRLMRAKDGMVTQIVARLAPALKVLSDRFVALARDAGTAKTVSTAFMSAMNFLVLEVGEVSIRLQGTAKELAAFWEMLKAAGSGSWEGVKKAFAEFNAVGAETDQRVKELKDSVKRFWTEAEQAADDGAKAAKDNSDKVAAPLVQSAEKVKDAAKAMEGFFNGIEKRKAALDAEAQTIGQNVGEQERLRLVLEGQALARAKNIPLDDQLRAKIDASAASAGAAVQRNDDLNRSYNRLVEAGNAVQSSLESAFVGAVTGANSLKDSIRSLMSDLARLAAQSAFRSLLGGAMGGGGLGDFFGKLFGAGGGASGPAGSIMVGGYQMPKFANGGAFRVGGSGGIDSQMVAFKASPNERVSITKPGQGTGGIVLQDNKTINVGGKVTTDDLMALRMELARDQASRRAEVVKIVHQARRDRML